MAKGDEHARNMLIEHNLRLVAHIVKKFENTGEDSEDLISIGTIGLIKAIESYSAGKGSVDDVFVFRFEDIDEADFVSFFILADRVV